MGIPPASLEPTDFESATGQLGYRANRLSPRPWSRLAERLEGVARNPGQQWRALPVVIVTGILAASSVLLLSRLSAGSTRNALRTALALVAVGFLGDLLAYFQKGKTTAGSVALIPNAAAIIVFPSHLTVLAIAGAQALSQLWHRRPILKSAFNVGQIGLSYAAALLALHFWNVVPPPVFGSGFAASSLSLVLPTSALLLVFLVVNSLCVAAVVAAVTRENIVKHWIDQNRSTAKYSFLHLPLVIYLAWLSTNMGVIGTLGMAVPILAVRQLTRTTVELTNVTEELLDLMVAAIEARDPYTSGHSKRVARASGIIARSMGLKSEAIERVEVAALLHDVGKIDEQFARILAKEGRLTPDEWETMKRHPVRSAELVGMLSSLSDIIPAVRHHHENWDGTGYPDGVRGAQIPLGSRIIMFADTLDAITTDRPYRKALDPEEARREFIKFRGKQFDPDICDAVVAPDVWNRLFEAIRRDQGAEPRSSREAVA